MKFRGTSRAIAQVLVACLAITLTVTGISSVNAQQQTNVSIIDLAQVFRSHPTFNAQLTKLQQDAENFKAEINRQREDLTRRQEAMMKLDPNSDAFRNEESNLAQIAARLEVDARNRIKVFAQREAELHYKTYMEVRGLIGNYCQQRGIAIVLTFNQIEVDTQNPDSIMRYVNGDVVYHQPHKDITKPIIQYLAQVASAGQPTQK